MQHLRNIAMVLSIGLFLTLGLRVIAIAKKYGMTFDEAALILTMTILVIVIWYIVFQKSIELVELFDSKRTGKKKGEFWKLIRIVWGSDPEQRRVSFRRLALRSIKEDEYMMGELRKHRKKIIRKLRENNRGYAAGITKGTHKDAIDLMNEHTGKEGIKKIEESMNKYLGNPWSIYPQHGSTFENLSGEIFYELAYLDQYRTMEVSNIFFGLMVGLKRSEQEEILYHMRNPGYPGVPMKKIEISWAEENHDELLRTISQRLAKATDEAGSSKGA